MKAIRADWTPGPRSDEYIYSDVFRITTTGYDIRITLGFVKLVDTEGVVHAREGMTIIMPRLISTTMAGSILEAIALDMDDDDEDDDDEEEHGEDGEHEPEEPPLPIFMGGLDGQFH